jgi:hypothetical protein
MSTLNDCYGKVIGLSTTTCECLTDQAPVDYTNSDSTLYIDQLDLSLQSLNGTSSCEEGGLWDIMSKSRDEAITAFRTDLLSLISTKTRSTRSQFSGVIGDADGIKYLLRNNYTHVGLTWLAAPVRSGTFKLKRIATDLNVATPITLKLYDNTSDVPLYTITVTPNLGQLTWHTLPNAITLPMQKPEVPFLQYWLLFEPNGVVKPKDHKVSCGCGSLGRVNIWNNLSPAFRNLPSPIARYNWLDWFILGGTHGNNLANRTESGWPVDTYVNGLLIDVEFACATNDIVCRDGVGLDYANDPNAMVIAYAVMYKAGVKLCEKILKSSNVNRYTLLDREKLYGKRDKYEKEYRDRIMYLSDQLTTTEQINLYSDCLTCKPQSGMRKSSLKVTY